MSLLQVVVAEEEEEEEEKEVGIVVVGKVVEAVAVVEVEAGIVVVAEKLADLAALGMVVDSFDVVVCSYEVGTAEVADGTAAEAVAGTA